MEMNFEGATAFEWVTPDLGYFTPTESPGEVGTFR
jgi:hypothetical protein